MTQLETRLLKELRSHIKSSGISMGEIARMSGVDISTLSRLNSDSRRGLNLSTAGQLCEYLGLVLGKPVPQAAKPTGRKKE